MAFVILLNIALWIYVINCLIRAKKVEIECNINFKIVPTLVFFIFGILQFLSNKCLVTLFTFISFTLASIAYYVSGSGLANDCVVITGKRYMYNHLFKMETYREKDNKGNEHLTIEFEHKHRVYFIYANVEDEDKIDKYLRKHCPVY